MIVGVAFAKPTAQIWRNVDVPEAATVRDAITASGLMEQFPEIDLEQNKVGVFGSIAKLDRVLKEGDRVEIYRPIHPDAELLEKKK